VSATLVPSDVTAATAAHDGLNLPSRADVRAAIPSDCFERSTARSFASLSLSLTVVGALVASAAAFLPLSWAWTPVWIAYAIATGTAATGLWVVAHECGHGAFSRHGWLQNTVGYVLHTALLVPYFSWQRSHAVHHARTNHLDEGETHVPRRADRTNGQTTLAFRSRIGGAAYAALTITKALLLGWPAYLLAGATGGPSRGRTNHFWPVRPFASDLFPRRWHARVWASTAGVAVVLAALVAAAAHFGPGAVLALYVGPYLVVNAWLVGYTWLQHTDVDIPHFAEGEWSWLLGAFQTVDRPYPRIVDVLHHRIGTTHVLHHIDHRIPHYHARRATAALRREFPEWYRFDPTPTAAALWRVGRDCVAVRDGGAGWRFTLD